MALDLTKYTLTFAEEFTGSTPSPVWRTSYGWSGGSGLPARTLAGNSEAEYYCDPAVTPGINPFTFTGNSLKITAAPSTNLTETYNLPYSSGMISTWDTWNQTFGYFEMRAKLPAGAGFWPAFWMLPAAISWPPELDIFEAFGGPFNKSGGSNQIHIGSVLGSAGVSKGGYGTEWITVPGNIYTGFHTYGLEWHEDFLTWYFDGVQIAQFTTPEDFTAPMYLIANLAVGSATAWPGPPAVGAVGVMEIDYIRAFSRMADPPAIAMPVVSSPDGVNTTPVGAHDINGVIGTPVVPPAAALDSLTVLAAADIVNGPAKFNLLVDGVTDSVVYSVTAKRGTTTTWQSVSIVHPGVSTAKTIGIKFLNDFFSGSMDENLYIKSIMINNGTTNKTVTLTAANLISNPANNTATTALATGEIPLYINGVATWTVPKA